MDDRLSLPRALLATLRLRQWIKNGLVLAPLFFAQKAFSPGMLGAALLATFAFCLMSSGVYTFNDLKDREKDRLHPRKRLRPIAHGDLSAGMAAGLGAILILSSLAIFWSINRPTFYGALAYLGLQVAYTTVLKRIAMVDVLVIALGFVLRVAVGALAIGVPISHWLYLCTLLLALFLGLGKRRAELIVLEQGAAAHRANLSELSVPLLDQLLSISACASIVCYALYTLSPETLAKFGTDGLKYTIPFVLYGLFRYLYLLHRERDGEGERPEMILLTDTPLLVDLLLFGVVAGLVLYL